MRNILTLTCPDTVGIIHKVTEFLAGNDCNIIECNQWSDLSNNKFFMRVAFDTDKSDLYLYDTFKSVADYYSMDYNTHPIDDPSQNTIHKILILVSKFDHCLSDILHRYKDDKRVEIVGIISNHMVAESSANWYGIPYYYLPVDYRNREEQEEEIRKICRSLKPKLVVLARYMQVLSEEFLHRYPSNMFINIHHSFLPSFEGASPYMQAFNKGVKIIGATAHFVTPDLDTGPIIEQDVVRVDHTFTPERLIAVGRDVENVVLSRAINLHIEHRIFINGNKTVVLR